MEFPEIDTIISGHFVIPDGVTEIPDYAFSVCGQLESVYIPDSVTTIGENAFSLCRKLESIRIPNSVTEIGDSAFEDCESLTLVEMPDSVKKIGERAFKGCMKLESIRIPDSVAEIGDGAFLLCTGLVSAEISESVEKIRKDTFAFCLNLKSVKIPHSVIEIEDRAFEFCESLNAAEIPASAKIGDGDTEMECLSFAEMLDAFERENVPVLHAGEGNPPYTGSTPIYPTRFHKQVFLAHGDIYNLSAFGEQVGRALFLDIDDKEQRAKYEELIAAEPPVLTKEQPGEQAKCTGIIHSYQGNSIEEFNLVKMHEMIETGLSTVYSVNDAESIPIIMPGIHLKGVAPAKRDLWVAKIVAMWLDENPDFTDRIIIVL